jgi:hypothetical protein
MRVGFVRNVGLAALGLAVAVTAACNDDPLSFDKDSTFDIQVNPSSMTVPAGVGVLLESRAVNQGGEPTWAEVTAVIAPACATVEPDPEALEIHPPGRFLITGLTTVGTCTITLTAGGITKEIPVGNVAGSIAIVDPPEVIEFGTSVQLDAEILNSAEPPEPMTPFANSDATWTSSDEVVATIDENGVMSAVGPGSTTITACWSGTDETGTSDIGYETCDEANIAVFAEQPEVVSIAPTSGLVGEVVTIDYTSGLPDNLVFIDGVELDPIFVESVTDTEIVFWWPYNGVDLHSVAVGWLVLPSEEVEFELTSDGSADDPAYLDPGTAPLTSLPMKKVAYLQPTVLDHYYLIELAAPATVIIDLDWDSGSDLDILVGDEAFTVFECTDGATGAQPEQSVCALDAGGHLIWINDYDESSATYVLEAAIQ